MNSYATIYDSVRGGMICIGKLTGTYGAIGAGAVEALEVELPGARVGDVVVVTPITGITNRVVLQSASITDEDEITVTLLNTSAGSLTPGETVFQVFLLKRSTPGGCESDDPDES